jgi:hypothetical protein
VTLVPSAPKAEDTLFRHQLITTKCPFRFGEVKSPEEDNGEQESMPCLSPGALMIGHDLSHLIPWTLSCHSLTARYLGGLNCCLGRKLQGEKHWQKVVGHQYSAASELCSNQSSCAEQVDMARRIADAASPLKVYYIQS